MENIAFSSRIPNEYFYLDFVRYQIGGMDELRMGCLSGDPKPGLVVRFSYIYQAFRSNIISKNNV